MSDTQIVVVKHRRTLIRGIIGLVSIVVCLSVAAAIVTSIVISNRPLLTSLTQMSTTTTSKLPSSTITSTSTSTPNQMIACSLTVFKNGGFENGDMNGWISGGGNRYSILTFDINVDDYLPNGVMHSADIASTLLNIVRPGEDPLLLNRIPNIVFRGNHSLRVGDIDIGGRASVVSQRIDRYLCDHIYFAWLAVLEASHDESESSIMIIELKDITRGDILIRRFYSTAPSSAGNESLFHNTTISSSGRVFYYTNWNIEHLILNESRRGHSFVLNILAADCSQNGHLGYVYLDSFGGLVP